ncbi:hypothetical protein Lalb_Chr04g0263011 [Lupinus albus]|uniref:Uncharacterized protein n=1 Tax=Lupinus albus TaxID=3870 RepID=A0A6A4QR60_LUPAL|nr:hypothetical protein Lalb_Chr04g0263011 [Lupinus albus]
MMMKRTLSSLSFSMKKGTFKSFLNFIVKEKKVMKPIVVKCGLALALTFAGFLYSRRRVRRIKPSPKGHPSGHGNEVNLGRSIRVSRSYSSISEGNIQDIEEICINKVISTNSPIGSKQNGEKGEFNNLVKDAEFGVTITRNSYKKDVESSRSKVGSPQAHGSFEKEDYEQEVRQLRSMIRMLQERERNLEIELLEYCGLREQEAAVMELQNRLKISNMETKMFSLKVETLQSENRRLEARVVDHAKVLSELENAKTKVKLLKKKIKYEAEQNREEIMNLKQKVTKLQDQELKGAANYLDIQIKLKRLKDLESEVEELTKSNLRLHIENADLARRLDSTQILANAVLEDPEADAVKEEGERLRQKNEGLVKEIEQLQEDRCKDLEELVYLRWINACLRHELKNYQPPPGKTVARDLSKSLSPTSEKKAKQLILEYANSEAQGSLSDFDSDQWSSPQTSFRTEPGECDDYSPLDNLSDTRYNTVPTSKSKIFSRFIKLIRGKDSQHRDSKVTSLEKCASRDDINSSHLRSSRSIGNGIDAEGHRSELATPTDTSMNSLDIKRTLSLKDEDMTNSDSLAAGSLKKYSLARRGSADFRNRVGSFSESPCMEKSNLVKYAEALKDSSGSSKIITHRRSASYSPF